MSVVLTPIVMTKRRSSRKGVAASQAALVDHSRGICGEEDHIVHQIVPRQRVQVAQVVLIRAHKPKLILDLQQAKKW